MRPANQPWNACCPFLRSALSAMSTPLVPLSLASTCKRHSTIEANKDGGAMSASDFVDFLGRVLTYGLGTAGVLYLLSKKIIDCWLTLQLLEPIE
jgi:hypothetical protein